MIAGGDLQGVMFAMTFVAMGLLAMWAFLRRVQVVFDRDQNTIDIRRKSLTRQTRVEHKLSYFGGAQVETSNSGDTATHRPVIHLNGGMSQGIHPLTKTYYSGSGAKRAVATINDWWASVD